MAIYITALARISSWPLEYILWRLPYAAGLQMMHAESRYQGQDVRLVHRSESTAPVSGLRDDFQRMKRRPSAAPLAHTAPA